MERRLNVRRHSTPWSGRRLGWRAVLARARRGRAAPYILAVCTVTLSWLVIELVQEEAPVYDYMLLFAAVVASARFWGFGPALAVTSLGVLGLDYSVLLPVDAFVLPDFGGLTHLILFAALALITSSLVYSPAGLPILLYHKVSLHHNDGLTISADRLDRQLAYIKSQGYTGISFLELKEYLEGRWPLPGKPVLVTFDDGYLSTYELAYPLLLKHQVKATVFLPTAFIGGMNGRDGGSEPLMSYHMIRQIAGTLIEFGLHSSRHENYQSYSAAQVEADLSECLRSLEESGCPFTRVFAYPYGRMPKDEGAQRAMREFFARRGIDFAVRIGSRINSLPPRDVYELKRSVVRGTDSFWEFKIKLRKGRTKPF